MAAKKQDRPPETDTDPTPTAKVEGRDLDGPDAPPVEEQSDEGELTKVYLVSGRYDEDFDLEPYLHDVVREAQRLGLRAQGDAYLEGYTVEEVGRYTSSRLVVKLPVRTAATA